MERRGNVVKYENKEVTVPSNLSVFTLVGG